MATVYTVTQINLYIKNMFANDYLLRNVQIKGELSNVKYHSSGHIYFTLKEDGSSINGVMFRQAQTQGLDFTLENGQSVQITGNVAVFERDGRYQIYAKKIDLDGKGNLYEAYEMLKQRLYEEGLFEFEHKKEIPQFPRKVGIVTAGTGAAIQDIRNIAKRRNPYVQLYLYPAKVQGEGAAKTIVSGIRNLDTMGLDTIIIGRGGGSIEDLWAFNEECVARAIYDAHTPIISGTGHEIDNTIADYVADLRAPTPSAACELAIPDIMALVRQLTRYESEMNQSMDQKLQKIRQQTDLLGTRLQSLSPSVKLEKQSLYLNALEMRLQNVSPIIRLKNDKIYLDMLQDKLCQFMEDRYKKVCYQYKLLLSKLDALSPTAKLSGGYGYIEGGNGEPVCSAADITEQDSFTVTVWDGKIHGVVTEVEKKEETDHG